MSVQMLKDAQCLCGCSEVGLQCWGEVRGREILGTQSWFTVYLKAARLLFHSHPSTVWVIQKTHWGFLSFPVKNQCIIWTTFHHQLNSLLPAVSIPLRAPASVLLSGLAAFSDEKSNPAWGFSRAASCQDLFSLPCHSYLWMANEDCGVTVELKTDADYCWQTITDPEVNL